MPALLPPLVALILAIVVTLVATVPAYVRLLRRLESELPDEFDRLGRPSLLDGSPRKSAALQKFIYSEVRHAQASAELSRLCRFLAVATPICVGGVFAAILWLASTGTGL